MQLSKVALPLESLLSISYNFLMKNLLTLTLAIFITSNVWAAADSVAVFHRPEKVIVLINERGESGRLHDMMNSMNVDSTLVTQTRDDSIKIQCSRIVDAVSCTFRFFPATGIQIKDKTLKARTLLSNLNLESENFEMLFESSREDKFVLKIIDGNINFYAAKKSL